MAAEGPDGGATCDQLNWDSPQDFVFICFKVATNLVAIIAWNLKLVISILIVSLVAVEVEELEEMEPNKNSNIILSGMNSDCSNSFNFSFISSLMFILCSAKKELQVL